MIITRTPFRVSFFGGGTDYPGWYRQNGGAVLSTTIDKYCYLTCRQLPPFFEHRIRVVYSKIEHCQTVDEIVHPAIRETLKFLGINEGLEIHHDGDLPARSGIGSSSAFTVGLLHALHSLKGSMCSKLQLAQEGMHVEQELLRENVGSQDQIATAFGGFNHIRFLPGGEFSVNPIILSQERLKELKGQLMMFYTGIKRTSSNIAATFVNNLENKKRQLRMTYSMVEEALEIIGSGKPLSNFGELLHDAWTIKREMSQSVSTGMIDEIYEEARSAGALGGKLLGAGGGGFLLLFVPPERQKLVRERLKQLIYVPFDFDFTGSQIIYYESDSDYTDLESYRQQQRISEFVDVDSFHPVTD